MKEIENKDCFLKACIDIGTNSCRLLIAETFRTKNKIFLGRELYKDLEIVKLGEDVNKNKFLKEEAIVRTVTALKKYRKIIDEFSIQEENIICFATSATRDSVNKDYFIKKVFEETKIKIRCISGEKEAYINFKGVQAGLKNSQNILVFDIGGGSTEFTFGDKKGIRKSISLDIGSVRITEQFFIKNNIYEYSKENIELAEKYLKNILKVLDDFKKENFDLIGVAGTSTTQISVRDKMEKYDSKKIHLSYLTKEEINSNLSLFLKNIPANLDIKGLDYKRRDVIIGGSIILKQILDYFEKNIIQISEFDNLIGAILGGLDD